MTVNYEAVCWYSLMTVSGNPPPSPLWEGGGSPGGDTWVGLRCVNCPQYQICHTCVWPLSIASWWDDMWCCNDNSCWCSVWHTTPADSTTALWGSVLFLETMTLLLHKTLLWPMFVCMWWFCRCCLICFSEEFKLSG